MDRASSVIQHPRIWRSNSSPPRTTLYDETNLETRYLHSFLQRFAPCIYHHLQWSHHHDLIYHPIWYTKKDTMMRRPFQQRMIKNKDKDLNYDDETNYIQTASSSSTTVVVEVVGTSNNSNSRKKKKKRIKRPSVASASALSSSLRLLLLIFVIMVVVIVVLIVPILRSDNNKLMIQHHTISSSDNTSNNNNDKKQQQQQQPATTLCPIEDVVESFENISDLVQIEKTLALNHHMLDQYNKHNWWNHKIKNANIPIIIKWKDLSWSETEQSRIGDKNTDFTVSFWIYLLNHSDLEQVIFRIVDPGPPGSNRVQRRRRRWDRSSLYSQDACTHASLHWPPMLVTWEVDLSHLRLGSTTRIWILPHLLHPNLWHYCNPRCRCIDKRTGC